MGVLRVRTPWTRQPQSPVRIDWNNAITKDLVFAFDEGCGHIDLVTGKPGNTRGSGVTSGVGDYGKQAVFSGTVADGACSFGAHQGLSGATQSTIDVLFKVNGATPSANIFAQWDTNQGWLFQISSGALAWVAADDNSGNRRRWGNSTSFFLTAGWYRVIASWQGGANAVYLQNGIDRTSELAVVNSAATSVGTTMDNLQIGTTNGGFDLAGAVVFARIWRRGLILPEMRYINDNPSSIYAP